MTQCDKCGNDKQRFITECEKVLCERCYIFHDGCDICENKGYGFNTRMAIVGFSKAYKITITSPIKL